MADALADAVNAGKVTEQGGFYTVPGQTVDVVRDRREAASPGLRRPETLPPEEVGFALREVARAAIGVTRDEAVIEVSRLLGFATTRSALRDLIERQLDHEVADGRLEEREGRLFVTEQNRR